MPPLRFLITALLTGWLVGCGESKSSKPVNSAQVVSEHMESKKKMGQEQLEGPKLRP
jgi:hypothetical protein